MQTYDFLIIQNFFIMLRFFLIKKFNKKVLYVFKRTKMAPVLKSLNRFRLCINFLILYLNNKMTIDEIKSIKYMNNSIKSYIIISLLFHKIISNWYSKIFLKLGNELSVANRCVNIRLSNNIKKHLEIEIVNSSNIHVKINFKNGLYFYQSDLFLSNSEKLFGIIFDTYY